MVCERGAEPGQPLLGQGLAQVRTDPKWRRGMTTDMAARSADWLMDVDGTQW